MCYQEEFTKIGQIQRITADKRLWCFAPLPKLASPTSFIRKTLREQPELINQNPEVVKKIRQILLSLGTEAIIRGSERPPDLTNHFEVAIALEVVGSVRRFSPEIELILFRITQEALRNVWKHSEASKARVTVEFGDDKTVLTVKDNGKGFELPERIEDLAVAGKLGLAGMQERAQLIGGRLTLQSEPGKGTTVTVEVPI